VLAINQTLYKKPLYNAATDFEQVALFADSARVLITRKDLPANTLPEFVAYAKAHQAKMQYGSAGVGAGTHVCAVLLDIAMGTKITHVPYRGAGPAMIDTIAGNVPSMFDSLPSAASHIKAGKVRALAVSGEERNPAFPDVPTMKESGYPDLISYSWFGISVPAKTPQPIVDRLATEMQAVLKEPAVVKRWEEIGAEASTATPAEVTRFIQAEIDKWTPVVKASGAKPE
jgi:tripartite-type tricarboxylate transporter receptor subunit TctC